MSAAPDTATAGRSRYEGFRGLIRAVGTGPRGSRSLDFDEAYAATVALLSGEVTDAQAGAFLLAMRVKGEEPEELAGMVQALRDAGRARWGAAPAGPEASAALTRAILGGDEDGPVAWAVVLSAGLRLHAAGLAATAERGAAMAQSAVAGGRALPALDALVG